MYITQLELVNFRNHSHKIIDFLPGINFLCGQNAKGKTNIIEAIYYFATTKSFRTSKDFLTIKDGCQFSTIKMDVSCNFGTINLQLDLSKQQKKIFYKNYEKYNNISKILGNFFAILFSPDELKIVKGSPEDRREFLDAAICELSSAYYNLLLKYEKVLASRNILLKKHASLNEIEVFDIQLANLASKITHQRKTFVDKIYNYANLNMKYLSSNKENLLVKYESTFFNDYSEENILSLLELNRQRDIELGYTTIGPHRDDIMLMSNEKDLRIFGSQGQQRTAVLALKLAVYEVFKDTTGEPPILLLDDVFSELDSVRAKLLLNKVKDAQTIITGTRAKTSQFSYNKIKL